VLEDVELFAGEGGFEAIGEADKEMFLVAGGSAGDNADSAAGVDEGVIRAADFDERDDLCAGEDVVGLVHSMRRQDHFVGAITSVGHHESFRHPAGVQTCITMPEPVAALEDSLADRLLSEHPSGVKGWLES
jgi:hypothetical protein